MITKQPKMETWRVLLEDKNANRIDWIGVTRRLSARIIERRSGASPSVGSRIVQAGRAVRRRYRRTVKK